MSFANDMMDIAINEAFYNPVINEFKKDIEAADSSRNFSNVLTGKHGSEFASDRKSRADSIRDKGSTGPVTNMEEKRRRDERSQANINLDKDNMKIRDQRRNS